MTWRVRRLLVVEVVVIGALLTIALDQYVHAKTDSLLGVNHRGYRGDVAGKRFAGETRIVLAGGARAFEAGTPMPETMLARLQHLLSSGRPAESGPVTVFNVASPTASRGAYARRLDRFRDIAPDIVCIYVDLQPAPAAPPPGLLARTAGYVPALPVLASLDATLGRLMPHLPTPSDDINGVAEALAIGRTLARGTIVAVPEPVTDQEAAVHASLMQLLGTAGADRRVAVVQLAATPATFRDDRPALAIARQLEGPARAFMNGDARTR